MKKYLFLKKKKKKRFLVHLSKGNNRGRLLFLHLAKLCGFFYEQSERNIQNNHYGFV